MLSVSLNKTFASFLPIIKQLFSLYDRPKISFMYFTVLNILHEYFPLLFIDGCFFAEMLPYKLITETVVKTVYTSR